MSMVHDDDERRHRPVPGGEVLWAIRAWVIGTCRDVPVQAQIRAALAPAAPASAAEALIAFMQAVGAGAHRKLTIACVCEPGTGADERLLLDVVALCQRHRRLQALTLLRTVLTPQATAQALDCAIALAAVLTTAGTWMDPPAAALPTLH